MSPLLHIWSRLSTALMIDTSTKILNLVSLQGCVYCLYALPGPSSPALWSPIPPWFLLSCHICPLHLTFLPFFFFSLATPRGMGDSSSPTSDLTRLKFHLNVLLTPFLRNLFDKLMLTLSQAVTEALPA